MRCKCCDKTLEEYEIIWYEDIQQHEDLCTECKTVVYEMESQHVVDSMYSDEELLNSVALRNIYGDTNDYDE
jgi:hypothetical protein